MKKIIIFGATGKVGCYVLDYAAKFFHGTEYEVIASGRRASAVFTDWGGGKYLTTLLISQTRKISANFHAKIFMQ